MPQPYPGQQWKHGWIPLTAAAVRSKNHGRKPGPKSKLGRQLAKLTSSSSRSGSGGRSRGGAASSPSAQMDVAIRSRAAQRSNRRSGGTNTAAADLDAAAAAIRSGDHARAVNLLTRAMNNTRDPKQRAAIKKQRDALAGKLMGRGRQQRNNQQRTPAEERERERIRQLDRLLEEDRR